MVDDERPGHRWVLPSRCNASSTFLREALTKAQIAQAKADGTYATLQIISQSLLSTIMKAQRWSFLNFLKKELPEMKNPTLLDVGSGPGLYDVFVHRHYNHRLRLIYFDGRTEDPKAKNLDGYHTNVRIMPFYKNDMSCTRDFAVANGAVFGLMFGMMDVEDAPQRLRTEERLSAPIGVIIGGIVGAVNAVLGYRAEASVGESIDLLRAEGLLDD